MSQQEHPDGSAIFTEQELAQLALALERSGRPPTAAESQRVLTWAMRIRLEHVILDGVLRGRYALGVSGGEVHLIDTGSMRYPEEYP
jgi:hypothetical protein